MEVGSKEHQKLITNNILKMSIKTMLLGVGIGLFLMAPSIIRENQFSLGLAYAGEGIILISIIYALGIAFKKYRMVRSSFQKD